MGIEKIVDFEIPPDRRIIEDPYHMLMEAFFGEMGQKYQVKDFAAEFLQAARYMYQNAYDSVLIKRHLSAGTGYQTRIIMKLEESEGTVKFTIKDNGMGVNLPIDKYPYHPLGVNGGRKKALLAVDRMLGKHNGQMGNTIDSNGAEYWFSLPTSELFYTKK